MTEVYENGVLTATYTYNANGTRATLSYANGNLTEYQYNLANRLIALTNKQGAEVLSQYTYTYLLDGNQVSKTDHVGQVTTYTYDDLGRLTSEAAGVQPAVTYTYDDYNNRASMAVVSGPVTSYSYDKNNRLTTETKVTGATSEITRYHYDGNGNQIGRITETVEPAVGEPEQFGMTISGVDDISSPVALYEYDGFNQLVADRHLHL